MSELGFNLDKLIGIVSNPTVKMSKKCKTLSANVKDALMRGKEKMGRK
jgi:hypothetical protein